MSIQKHLYNSNFAFIIPERNNMQLQTKFMHLLCVERHAQSQRKI